MWLSLQKFWWYLDEGPEQARGIRGIKHLQETVISSVVPFKTPRQDYLPPWDLQFSIMDHSHQKEEKREAGRKKACSEWFVEAHESQFENVPFCTAVAASRLRSQLDPTNSQLYTKAQMDKKLQRFPWKNMWHHTLHSFPFQNASPDSVWMLIPDLPS